MSSQAPQDETSAQQPFAMSGSGTDNSAGRNRCIADPDHRKRSASAAKYDVQTECLPYKLAACMPANQPGSFVVPATLKASEGFHSSPALQRASFVK